MLMVVMTMMMMMMVMMIDDDDDDDDDDDGAPMKTMTMMVMRHKTQSKTGATPGSHLSLASSQAK